MGLYRDSERAPAGALPAPLAPSTGNAPGALGVYLGIGVTPLGQRVFEPGGSSSCQKDGSVSTVCLPPRSPSGAAGFREDPLLYPGRAPSGFADDAPHPQMTHPDQLRALAQAELGPESASALEDWEFASAFDAARAAGADELDALLQVAFEVSKKNRAVQGEFLSFFRGLLFGLSTPSAQAPAERRPEKGETDLMQSVVGDLLPGFESLYFNSRAQFLSLIQQRLRWKRLDRMKSLGPVPHSHLGELDQLALDTEGEGQLSTPLTELIQSEGEAKIAAALHRLSAPDGKLIRAVIDGVPRDLMTKELGISPEALRQRLRRARVAFQKALQRGKGTPGS